MAGSFLRGAARFGGGFARQLGSDLATNAMQETALYGMDRATGSHNSRITKALGPQHKPQNQFARPNRFANQFMGNPKTSFSSFADPKQGY